MYRQKDIPERIRTKFKVDQETKCWVWQGWKSGNGYGQVRCDKQKLMAHRLTYCLLVGEIPYGKVLDHLCRNRACCNPDHLEPVTVQENTRGGNAKLYKARSEYEILNEEIPF